MVVMVVLKKLFSIVVLVEIHGDVSRNDYDCVMKVDLRTGSGTAW